jgi:hypothetical protein
MISIVRAKIQEIRVGVGALLLLAAAVAPVRAQTVNNVMFLDFNYGVEFPAADFAERFGNSNSIGIGLERASIKQKVFAGIDGRYFFGNTVKEDVLTNLRSGDGNIIGIDQQLGDVHLKQRGFYVGGHIGKIFSTGKHDFTLTGIRTQVGLGLLQHKIRVQDNFKTIAALNKKYLPGYDRLTNGAALQIGLGYQYDHPVNNWHIRIMGDMIAAKTKSRRDFDYATGGPMDDNRTDIMFGLNLSYIVTISRSNKEEFIYY